MSRINELDTEDNTEQLLDRVQGIAHVDLGQVDSGPPGGVERRKGKRAALIYTTSKWQAIAHISGTKTAVEARYPDPWTLFPSRIMKQVDYGIHAAGLECYVIEYDSVEGQPLGVILYLHAGKMDIACYAIRFDEKTRIKGTQFGGTRGYRDVQINEHEEDEQKSCTTVH